MEMRVYDSGSLPLPEQKWGKVFSKQSGTAWKRLCVINTRRRFFAI